MTPEQKIQQLENEIFMLKKELKDFKDLFDSIFKDTQPTKIYFKNQVQFDKQGLIGFYGKYPVKQQTLASDTLANLLTALRSLGLIS